MKDWKQDKKWSDKYLNEIKAILGQVFIGEASKEDDQEKNTDLIVLKLEAIRIACRIRDEKYYQKYGKEFTIRAGRPGGTKTELAKIIEGWGDYFFYGFADEERLIWWSIGDLKVFRLWFNQQLRINRGVVPGICQKNQDGSSNFLAFLWEELPGTFVVRNSKRE